MRTDCGHGFYAGWHANEARQLEACLELCLGETRCRYVAFLQDRSCSRYDERAGACDRSSVDEQAAPTAHPTAFPARRV